MDINKLKIEYRNEISSTNDYVYDLVANNKLDTDYLLVAYRQTDGHGTNGRSFLSEDNGVYFSLALFYDREITALTAKVAVSVHQAFNKLYNIDMDIKWVNDLYYNNKKVVGILCKNISHKKCYIIGIGIDLYKNIKIPDDLKNIMGYIFDKKIDEKLLINEIINNIYNNSYQNLDPIYNNKNIVINKKFLYNNKRNIVKYINDEGAMVALDLDTNVESIFVSSENIIYE